MRKSTASVHEGGYRDKNVYGINTPIYRSSAFLFPNAENLIRYPRYTNIPTQDAPGKKICALEGGEDGLVLASGLGAISVTLLSLLAPGDHAVFQSGLYGGTQHLVANQIERLGIKTTIVPTTNVKDYEAAIKKNTKVIYIESPTNPLLDVVDLKAMAKVAKKHGVVTVIDNTFASPINQRPIEHGIDIVVHSGTKYLNGHSDLCAGAVVGPKKYMGVIRKTAMDMGPTLDMEASYMLERGMKTLGIRVQRQNENAMAISEFLQQHPKVRKVYYPGLPSHPGHKIAKKQMDGFGGMMSFELDCSLKSALRFADSMEFISPAISLGGVETILTFPAQTSHSYLSAKERRAQGISDTLIRFSVGIEDKEDLIADLGKGLRKI